MSSHSGKNICKALLAAAYAVLACTQAAYAGSFKPLPHDLRACMATDLDGLYKLKDVMEKPKPGNATLDFQNAPHQYIFFRKTQTYVEVSGSLNYIDARMMDNELQKRFKQDKRQYVLTESGALYFYKGGKPIETNDCEVVVKADPPYEQGEMLLVLPGPDSLTVKVYRPNPFQAPVAPPPPPPGQPGFVPRGR